LPDDKKFAVIDGLRRALKDRGSINELDGVRVTYDDGAWALVRASNTGPCWCCASKRRARTSQRDSH